MASYDGGEIIPSIKKPNVDNTRIRPTPYETPAGHLNSDPEARRKSSCCSSLCYYLSSITVEPVIFLQMVSYGMEDVSKTNMILGKTCAIQLHYSQDICDNLNTGQYHREQDTVQKITNDYSLYCKWIELLPAIFTTMLLGAWSDAYGRKLPLMLPLVGSTLKALGLTLNAYWWSIQPFYILLSYIPYGLTGNLMVTFMATSAYVCEDSGQRSRTTRLSVLILTMNVSIPLGYAVGMYFFKTGGYVTIFGAEFLFCLLSLLYTLVRIRNKPPKREDSQGPEPERSGLSLSLMKKSLLVVFKERENRDRAQVLGQISCICLYMINLCVLSFMYVYTRKKFQWDYYDYTVWFISSTPSSLLGSCVLLPLLSLYWRLEDSVIGFIGSTTLMFFWVMVGTAPEPWVLYLALLPFACSTMVSTASRSALSKLVASDELGSVYSVVGMGEALFPVLFTPFYTLIYNSTLDVFPGTIFIFTSLIILVICFIHVWILTSFEPAKATKAEISRSGAT
ncbi:proton-coupled folate transporter-like [Panulirus ornatus]|uniref:proton-coupled folate transporter-like n=1 Tax=Panulirus ornatus TaxID=150431 RepID=UPI003A83BBF3